METDSKEAKLTLHIAKADGEANVDELDQLTHTLMRYLEDMDVESVTLLHEQEHLPGAKGGLFIVGGMLVSILPTAFPKVMEFLQSWVSQNIGHTIRAKVQRGDRSAEIEYPSNMPPDELKSHLEAIKQMIEG